MEYSLGPVPWSLATADGMPIKADLKTVPHPKLQIKTDNIHK